jgi:hypothetical protein
MGEKADASKFFRYCRWMVLHGECLRYRKFLQYRVVEEFRLGSHRLGGVDRRHKWLLVGWSVPKYHGRFGQFHLSSIVIPWASPGGCIDCGGRYR